MTLITFNNFGGRCFHPVDGSIEFKKEVARFKDSLTNQVFNCSAYAVDYIHNASEVVYNGCVDGMDAVCIHEIKHNDCVSFDYENGTINTAGLCGLRISDLISIG